MTKAQIIGELLISLFVLLIGSILAPLFKKLWERMNRPSPLDPQTKVQYVTYLATLENSLERLNYYSAHPKDLFLYLIQLGTAAILCCACAAFLYTLERLLILTEPVPALLHLAEILFLAFAVFFCLLGVSEAGTMSDKKVEAAKGKIQKQIDDTKKRLNPPV